MIDPPVDQQENDIFELSPQLLDTLLKDHTMSTDECQVNIFWATDSNAYLGDGYQYADQITVDAITGDNRNVIVPRAVKSRQEQQQRSRDMAEVFTPSWICNKQNNLIDNAWFGREGVFNTEVDYPDGTRSWIVNANPVVFPEGKTWRDYVNENRLEITCGEAPFLVSRYDRVTGEFIPVDRRIGLLDRKLRVVCENTDSTGDWVTAARAAYMSIYGYEWQGDSIVLARKALLSTFIEFYQDKFHKDPSIELLLEIADIISWNIWQMDGLKGVIPNSCNNAAKYHNEVPSLFSPEDLEDHKTQTLSDCPGCKNKDIFLHTGKYAIIRDWKEDKVLPFVSLIKG